MLKRYLEFIKENVVEKKFYKPTNLIQEICVSMVLLNNNFLDNILDAGQSARYRENSHVFLNDLKNLVMSKNRLHIGKFEGDKCVVETDSKISNLFETVEFSIEDDWDKLVNSRIIARNIIDKLIPGDKLRSEMIKSIYWIGPNMDKEHQENIVIELEDGRQFSFFLNKNITMSKTSSFNTFADELIGEELDNLFGDEYINKWDKLTQVWIKTIYENANKNMQIHIEKFIDPKRIDSIGYFEFFDIIHKEPRYKFLGEHIREFDKNFIKLSNLMTEIWKNRDICFIDPERVYKEWTERKIYILNSRILEHLFTESLIKNNLEDITKLEDNFKLAEGVVKMKFIKTLVDKLGCLERSIYYLGNNGNSFYQIPSRKFFRDNYDNINVKFDYHVKLVVDEQDEEKNDFNIKLIFELNHEPLINCDINVAFSGGEMSSRLSAKYKFEPSDDFNSKVSNRKEDI
jgi:hypothetical protein